MSETLLSVWHVCNGPYKFSLFLAYLKFPFSFRSERSSPNLGLHQLPVIERLDREFQSTRTNAYKKSTMFRDRRMIPLRMQEGILDKYQISWPLKLAG